MSYLVNRPLIKSTININKALVRLQDLAFRDTKKLVLLGIVGNVDIEEGAKVF